MGELLKSVAAEDAAHSKKQRKTKIEGFMAEAKYCLDGLETLVLAVAFAVTSIWSIYSGQHFTMPTWGTWALTIAGAVIALEAFLQFAKLIRRKG